MQGWQIRMLGGFKIESPQGGSIYISSRKARALLALLALNDGVAVSRDWLGRQLWSDKSKLSQQQNLRQAMTQLRAAFLPIEIFEAGRDTCRLAVEYRCDALECLNSGKDAGTAVFLPEMPEEIFDSYRTELASFAPSGELGEAARAAAGLLDWAVAHEPERVIDILYSCRELIPNMPLPMMESVMRAGLKDLPEEHARYRWGLVQFATVLMWAGHCEEGIKVAKRALDGWEPSHDDPDWTAAAYSAASFLIFRGRLDRAVSFIDSMAEVAKTHGLEEATRRFIHAKALWHGYSGEFGKAIELLQSLPASDIVNIHLAIYHTLQGLPGKARQYLSLVQGAELGARLGSQSRVAMAYLLVAEGRKEEARVALTELLALCDGFGIFLVKIHALEGLALIADEETERLGLLNRALELRENLRFPLLPGDRIRLREILKSE